MMKTTRALSLLAWILVLGGGNQNAFSGGFMIPHQTARGVALSNAMTAGVNDPSAVYYNPAALSEVDGNELLLTGNYVNAISSVENGGRKAVNKHDDAFLANVFANYHIPASNITVGIGSYSPFGLATTYERSFTRFAAERSELRTLYITPAVSWHPSKQFSLGGGISFIHASALFTRSLCFDVFTGCPNPGGLFEGRLRATDTANSWAYNLGLLYKPTESLKLGFSYRSRSDLRFDNADVKLGGIFSPNKTKAEIRPLALPPVINAGVHWQITPEWGGEFVYEYTRWSEFNRLGARFSPTPFFGPFPIPGFSLPQKWKNTSTLRLGSAYAVNRNLELRAGIGLEETPTPNRTLNPSIPGGDTLTLNSGIGYRWDKVSLELGYMAAFFKTRRISNNELEGLPATGIPFLGAPGRDKYKTFDHFVSLSAGYKF